MRGMDHKESAQTLIEGMRIYHNYIRPHQALEGKTPAEASAINLHLKENKIASLIRMAANSGENHHKQ